MPTSPLRVTEGPRAGIVIGGACSYEFYFGFAHSRNFPSMIVTKLPLAIGVDHAVRVQPAGGAFVVLKPEAAGGPNLVASL